MVLRSAAGEGVVLDGDGKPFHDALARPAEPAEVAEWLGDDRPQRARRSRSASSCSRPACPPRSTPAGSTGTRSCAASRAPGRRTRSASCSSGCCVETDLRIVILDPNSDFVRLGEHPRGRRRGARRGATRRPRQASSSAAPARACSCRSTQLDPRRQAAVAARSIRSPTARSTRLVDQLLGEGVDRSKSWRRRRSRTRGRFVCGPRTSASERGGSGRAASRGRSSTTSSDRDARCLVVDLGSLPTREEQARRRGGGARRRSGGERADREPVLVVIDEAHNVCPAEPDDPVTALVDRARGPDRRRGAQVRPLPARLDAAAAEGARERAQPVRQPRCSCG